jgi:ribose 5-phosphate isomerase A
MARGLAARALVALGGRPIYRQGVVTDNGNIILDVHELDLADPAAMESRINDIVGVVCNGIFAAQAADVVIAAGAGGVRTL